MYVTTVFSITPHKLSNVQQCHNFSSSIKLQNIKCVGFYWRFHMMFLLSGCCVMDSKSSTASVNISLNSGSERKKLFGHYSTKCHNK
jgi:hypothetical protein